MDAIEDLIEADNPCIFANSKSYRLCDRGSRGTMLANRRTNPDGRRHESVAEKREMSSLEAHGP